MVKRGRKTKFLRTILPVYSAKQYAKSAEQDGVAPMFPILRFDCNMQQLPGEFKWVTP